MKYINAYIITFKNIYMRTGNYMHSQNLVSINLLAFISVFCFITSCTKITDIKNDSLQEAGIDESLAARKPNIIILLADDVGYEIPTCDGGQSYETPNIDNLAQSGRRFTQCHAGPMCSPSRFMLFTGKYNFRNYFLWGRMDQSNKTIANMLADKGYATCYAGKWQLDGGDTAIRTFGWQKYSVWLPYYVDKESEYGTRYKGAQIYQDGGYLPSSQTKDKFSEDEFTDYIIHFMDSVNNLGKPFFINYSMALCHTPFSPTPDDPEYATWDFDGNKSNPRFYASMMKYADKKIGQIMQHLSDKNLLRNTLVMYTGDNGTPDAISSQFNGFTVYGSKGETTEPGTNVPLIAVWKGRVPANTVSNSVIDFTDFLPTLADVAFISKPSTYGTLDGVSFFPALVKKGADTIVQKTLYDCFSMNRYETAPEDTWVRWTQNDSYKLYDSGNYVESEKFLKIEKGKPDGDTLSDAELTPEEVRIKARFKSILKSYNP